MQFEKKKLFIGGLNAQIPSDAITTYFANFGELSELYLYGSYGFVEYKKRSDVEKVLKKKRHRINETELDVKPALSRNGTNHRHKVFAFGIGPEISKRDIQREFERFGSVYDCFITKDFQNGKRRATACISYLSLEGMWRALQERFVIIKNQYIGIRPDLNYQDGQYEWDMGIERSQPLVSGHMPIMHNPGFPAFPAQQMLQQNYVQQIPFGLPIVADTYGWNPVVPSMSVAYPAASVAMNDFSDRGSMSLKPNFKRRRQ